MTLSQLQMFVLALINLNNLQKTGDTVPKWGEKKPLQDWTIFLLISAYYFHPVKIYAN